jgi:hypothetical protein
MVAMSRFSRFDKLENERRPAKEQAPDEPASGASMERFGEAPKVAERAPDPEAPESAPALERFTADGTEVLRTNDDELVRLPFLECPECKGQAGKFDTTCFNCGTRLDTREARAHNLARLEVLKAEREEAKANEVARREAEIAQATERRAEERAVLSGELAGLRGDRQGGSNELLRYLGVWAAIVVAAALAMELTSNARWVFAGLAFVLFLTRIPLGVWRVLGRHVDLNGP